MQVTNEQNPYSIPLIKIGTCKGKKKFESLFFQVFYENYSTSI